MIRALLLYLLIVVFWSAAFSVVAFLGGRETDCYTEVIVAILALGGVFALDYLEVERDRRIRDERSRTWARRDKETGL
ncbi:hypothetical protein VIMS_02495 [Mycobacterium marinum]|uniref:hypothetical protein n=1 Tax=Mycobacterium marinum TaxID=1781 RepID=UPI000E3E2346|nr:hypothetical protein [Mycobacterium marinum]RFZ15065.1 hypothetical protein VIMS_02495 [Mycobacterium marinum]